MNDEYFMKIAIEEAKKGDFPNVKNCFYRFITQVLTSFTIGVTIFKSHPGLYFN